MYYVKLSSLAKWQSHDG